MGLLRMRQHSPECGDRVTARAQTCLPSIALATEGLRTPGTASAIVNEFRKSQLRLFLTCAELVDAVYRRIFVIRMVDIRLFKSCSLDRLIQRQLIHAANLHISLTIAKSMN